MPPPRRVLPAARRILGPAVSFGGRIAGIAVTLLIVRYTGVGAAAVPVLLAIAIFAFAQSALNGPLEMQVIAERGLNPASPPGRLLITSLLLGAVSGTIMTVAAIVLSRTASGLDAISWYFLPLGLALPFATCFSAIQGIEIARDSWTAAGIASFIRTAVIVILVALFMGTVGLIAVPIAFLVGEVVRLGLVCRRLTVPGSLSWQVDRAFGWRVAQQVPSSMLTSVAPAVDRLLVATLGLGSIAVLDLADKATGFLNLSSTQGLIPVLYRRWAQISDPLERRARLLRTARTMLVSCLGIAVVAASCLPVVVAWIAGISDPTVRSSLELTICFLLAGFPGYVASQVLVRLMILDGLQRWFNLTAAIQLVANVLLDLFLGLRWGVPGVAAATAIVWWLGLALCFLVQRRASSRLHEPASLPSGEVLPP